ARRQETHDAAQQRRLAGAVAADEPDHGAGLKRDRGAADDADRPDIDINGVERQAHGPAPARRGAWQRRIRGLSLARVGFPDRLLGRVLLNFFLLRNSQTTARSRGDRYAMTKTAIG